MNLIETLLVSTLLLFTQQIPTNYKKYQILCREEFDISMTFPDSMITYKGGADMIDIIFRKWELNGPSPVFFCGPVLNVSNNCFIVFEDLKFFSKPTGSSYPKNPETFNDYPRKTALEGIIRYNWGLPWEKSRIPKKKEIKKEKTWNELKMINTYRDTDLLRRMNADVLLIAQIPYFKQITCEYSPLKKMMKRVSCCYGIEIHRQGRMAIRLLCFTNEDDENSILNYIEKIGKDLKFL